MEISGLLAFTAVAATLLVVPGPDWALVLGVGSRRGLVAPAVAGLALGYVVVTTVVVAGVAPLVARPTALLVLTLLGAAYLLHLGVGMLRSPADAPGAPAARLAEDDAVDGLGVRRVLRRGVGVSALNPKALLFFLAFLPQFASPRAALPITAQLAVLGLTWVLLAAVFYSLLGYAALRSLQRRPALGRLLTRVSGAVMVLAGVALPIEQLVRHAART